MGRERHHLYVSAHLGATGGIAHAVDWLAGVGDFPHRPLQVELIPARKAQFAGAHEHVQRQQYSQFG
ncbi:hypothetical protein D3C76_1291250 [compost metagenome]